MLNHFCINFEPNKLSDVEAVSADYCLPEKQHSISSSWDMCDIISEPYHKLMISLILSMIRNLILLSTLSTKNLQVAIVDNPVTTLPPHAAATSHVRLHTACTCVSRDRTRPSRARRASWSAQAGGKKVLEIAGP